MKLEDKRFVIISRPYTVVGKAREMKMLGKVRRSEKLPHNPSEKPGKPCYQKRTVKEGLWKEKLASMWMLPLWV